jgi:hypothetical protein
MNLSVGRADQPVNGSIGLPASRAGLPRNATVWGIFTQPNKTVRNFTTTLGKPAKGTR